MSDLQEARALTLDRLTRTFTRDKAFCSALSDANADQVARILVYLRWTAQYLNPIQVELSAVASQHFPSKKASQAGTWTVALLGAIGRDIGIMAYMVVRGLVTDAGFAARRSLENVGVLSAFWRYPEKAAALTQDEKFRETFVWERDRKARAALKAIGVSKRFEACAMPKVASDLYGLLSQYTVHGGSLDAFASAEMIPTPYSCMFFNRPDPASDGLRDNIRLIGSATEMLVVEIATLLGVARTTYGLPPSDAGEGGAFAAGLIDVDSGQMAHLVEATLRDLKWYRVAGSP
jgi:hypothetical protein